MRWDAKGMLTTAGMFIAFILLLSLWGFYSAIRPFRITTPASINPQYFGLKYENVEFKTKDDVTIHGWFIPNPNPHAKTIILLHGYPADKGNILPSRYFLHKNYHLLFLDFRYLGESGGNYSTVGKNEVWDVLAAIEFLKKRGINEIGIWGLSLGGAVAIMAAADAKEIKAIVAESSYASLEKMSYEYFRIPLLRYPLAMMLRIWGWLFLGYDIREVSPEKSAAKLDIPILLMHSRRDEVVSFSNAELLKKSLDGKKNVEILFFDNLQHGELPKDYQKIIGEFFAKNL